MRDKIKKISMFTIIVVMTLVGCSKENNTVNLI